MTLRACSGPGPFVLDVEIETTIKGSFLEVDVSHGGGGGRGLGEMSQGDKINTYVLCCTKDEIKPGQRCTCISLSNCISQSWGNKIGRSCDKTIKSTKSNQIKSNQMKSNIFFSNSDLQS